MRIVRYVFAADEESHQRPALLRGVIADRAAQHWIVGFERVDDSALRDWRIDIEFYFAAYAGERAQMMREDNTNHRIKSQ